MINIKLFKKKAFDENPIQDPTKKALIDTLTRIQDEIIKNGDQALINYTQKFDDVRLTTETLTITEKDITNAYDSVSKEYVTTIKKASKNITTFHENQIPHDWEEDLENNVTYGMQYKPIEKAGLYVPGGKALYPSTVLMNAIPATLAGVSTLIITTPPQKNGQLAPEIIVAAKESGVTQIIKVGGAQAIFALAYGTETVQKVDKIVGPGNIYVDSAKQMVYGRVDIDKPAGPSEVCVYIENEKYAHYAAAELLAQCEHDPNASVYAISPDEIVLKLIQSKLTKQLTSLNRQDIIKDAMKNSVLLLVNDQNEGLEAIDTVASEHLVLLIDDADEMRRNVTHAGSIFCGPYSPVALGDYIAGPNHVLPTARAARFASPLGVMDFMKFSTHLTYSKEALDAVKEDIKIFTEIEKLDAHYQSVKIRD